MKRIPSLAGAVLRLLLVLVACVPFWFLLVTALSRPEWRSLFVPELYWANLAVAWQKSALGRAMANSLAITVGAVLLVVGASASAGFAFARIPNRFHKTVYHAFLLSMMVPAIINTVPLYVLMRRIHGVNTLWAMILLLATGAIPFASFLYTGFIGGMSREVEESAYLEGCTWFSAFWRVVFPLLKPVTASVIILNGISIWNNYAAAVFFLQKRERYTVPLAISGFVQTYGADWNLMAAAAVIGLLPAVSVFLLFQRHFTKGITAGSVKG